MPRVDELEAEFDGLGIDYSHPEFYNSEGFRRAEAKDSELMVAYAEYVKTRSYSAAYLERARETVPKIVAFLHEELLKDGRLGACIDASLAASKILEQYGFWTTIEAGSLTLEFEDERPSRYFAQMMVPGNTAKVGHAWLHVPPFRLVDLTITRQARNEDIAKMMGGPLLAEKVGDVAGVTIHDMVDQDLQAEWKKRLGRIPRIEEVMVSQQATADTIRRLGAFSVRKKGLTLKYFPCLATALEETFEQCTTHCFSGKSAVEIFEELAGIVGRPAEVGAIG